MAVEGLLGQLPIDVRVEWEGLQQVFDRRAIERGAARRLQPAEKFDCTPVVGAAVDQPIGGFCDREARCHPPEAQIVRGSEAAVIIRCPSGPCIHANSAMKPCTMRPWGVKLSSTRPTN